MTGANFERKLRDKLRKEGWLVFRSAGSHVADLIALKVIRKLIGGLPNVTVEHITIDHQIIEVKTTNKNRVKTNINKQSKEQFDMLNDFAKQGFNVYYYVWFKGKRLDWKKFKLPLEPYPVFKCE